MDELGQTFAPLLLVLALSLLVLPHLRTDNAAARAIGAFVTAALLLRYLYWRFTVTLPDFDLDPHSLVAWGFFAVESAGACATLLLLHVLSRSRGRSAEATANPVEEFPGGPPLIDVFIPTYNEQRAILYRTIVGALAQDYPRFRVWVLDDGRRPWLASLAAELGAHYRIRGDNDHGKAGNMNAALAHVVNLPESPDVIAVLDADFVPTPRFLRRAAALLHDGRVGCVQTPQHFFNPDPIQLNLAATSYIPDEQRFFFDVIQPAKDAHGTSFSCGTSGLVRTHCLNLIGGFPTESVTEDLLLSIKLTGLGYKTVYLNEPLTAGLAPEGLHEYLTQRGRWCLGTMQIMRTRWGPLSIGPTPWLMRLHTLDSVMFWTTGSLVRLLCVLAPILYWWTGLVVMDADLAGIVEHMGPYWVCSIAFFGWVSRGINTPLLSEAMAFLSCRETLRASIIGLFGSRHQKFKVTAKGATRDRTMVQWSLVSWFMGATVLTVGGMLLGLLRGPLEGTPSGVEAMVVFWSIYNVITLMVASLMCIERPRFRREERFGADEAAELLHSDGTTLARLRDISLHGCRLLVPGGATLEVGDPVSIRMADVGDVSGTVRRLTDVGCHIVFETTPQIQAALTRKLFSGAYLRPITRMGTFGLMRILLQRAFG